MAPKPTVTKLEPRHPANYSPAHHVGSPPTSFQNPWPSYNHSSPLQALKARWFSSSKNYIPVPTDKTHLVPVRKPSFAQQPTPPADEREGLLKVTWFGHASFLISLNGLTILCDPVFSKTAGPYGMVGPTRFIDLPCEVEDLPDVDAVCISHDHYDHLDAATLGRLVKRRGGDVRFFVALGGKSVLIGLGVGIVEAQVCEMDWWDGVRLENSRGGDGSGGGSGNGGGVELVCTPAQHRSGRAPWNFQGSLWCSWIVRSSSSSTNTSTSPSTHSSRSLFFAGDTAYCYVPSDSSPSHYNAPTPPCPAFAEIGALYGPFDLSLLPIGCYSPRSFMSGVHSSPEDAVAIHKDVKSRRSLGMHFGTFRGSISQHYEPVTEPPERWREVAEKAGLRWRFDGGHGADRKEDGREREGEWEVGVMGVGETVVV